MDIVKIIRLLIDVLTFGLTYYRRKKKEEESKK